MARGRKKQEVEEGYVKERFIVDLVLSTEELAKINEVGKTKYITELVKKDFNTSKTDEASYSLTVTDEIRERFNNDPRRAYLLGQLLTEFYCNMQTEVTPVVNIKTEPKISTKDKFKEEKVVEIEETIIEMFEQDIEDTLIDDKKISDEVIDIKEELPKGEEVATELEKQEVVNTNVSTGDERVGRLNTAPLMKKRLGSK